MTLDQLRTILTATGLPAALHHWDHPPKPPYVVYMDDSTDNFAADNVAYLEITNYWVELYDNRRNRAAEKKIEDALTAAGIFWDRETDYIESERLYQTRYEIEV